MLCWSFETYLFLLRKDKVLFPQFQTQMAHLLTVEQLMRKKEGKDSIGRHLKVDHIILLAYRGRLNKHFNQQ